MMSHTSSDGSNKQPDPSSKGIPLPRSRRIQLDEEELWNLDDDLSSLPKATPAQEQAVESAIPTKQSSDLVTRIEPSRNRAPLARPREEMDPWSEEDPEKGSTEFIPLLANVQEKLPAKTATPSKLPIGLGRTEDEIWGDFVDDETPAEPVLPERSENAADATNLLATANLAQDHRHWQQEVHTQSADDKSSAPQPMQKNADLLKVDDSSSEENKNSTDASEFSAPQSNKERLSEKTSWKWPQFSKIEQLSLLASFALLGLLALGSLMLFQKNIHSQENPYLEPNMPCEGEIARIEDYSTYWRNPIREGKNADPTRLEVISIPVIELTLGPSDQPSGVIRVVFFNERGEIAGDTQTQSFDGGVFRKNGQNTIAFSATTGFTSFGDQEAYRARQIKPWVVRVYEATDENAPSSSYRLLFSTALSIKRQ